VLFTFAREAAGALGTRLSLATENLYSSGVLRAAVIEDSCGATSLRGAKRRSNPPFLSR
jgi:hypothetical protein